MGSSLFSVENRHTGLARLLRLMLPLCYGFVTARTSIPSPFYRDVTGVTAPEGVEGGNRGYTCIHTLQWATVIPNPLLHSTLLNIEMLPQLRAVMSVNLSNSLGCSNMLSCTKAVTRSSIRHAPADFLGPRFRPRDGLSAGDRRELPYRDAGAG